MEFTDWLEYEDASPIEDDYDFWDARQVGKAIPQRATRKRGSFS